MPWFHKALITQQTDWDGSEKYKRLFSEQTTKSMCENWAEL